MQRGQKKIFCISAVIGLLVGLGLAAQRCGGTPSIGYEPVYTVTFIAEHGGHIEGESVQYVTRGDTISFVCAVADDGYRFTHWSDGSPYDIFSTFTVRRDCTFIAYFEEMRYTLRYAAIDGGSIEGETVQQIGVNAAATAVTAVPDEGNAFLRWSDGVTSETRLDDDVDDDLLAVAIFTTTAKYSTGAGGGYIDGETEQTLYCSTDAAAVVAVPEIGYSFVRWSDGVETAERRDKHVTAPIDVAAIFSTSAVYTATQGGSVIGESVQTVECGADAGKVTAVPEDGYKFIGWSDGVETAERQDTCVTAPLNVTALFERTDELGGATENIALISGAKRLPYIKNFDEYIALTVEKARIK